ncbi:MAG: 6-phosphofructokinase [Spirochaetes bacterium]|nr:6-phosphofructokinase [Spirochaetota bacterium]
MNKKVKSIGILTSGGDCPGLNAAIRGIVKTVMRHNISVIGILDGFTGLVYNRVIQLGSREMIGLLTMGGTILGTSRNKPHKMPAEDGSVRDMTGAAIENYHRLGLDALVCLGGGGTQKNAYRLMQEGNLNIITLPKTIDNDIWGTDVSFGYDTGMTIACEAIDRLHTTASSHQRIMLVDIMGHNAGWLALSAGIAGGADIILIPEIEYKRNKVLDAIVERRNNDRRFTIISVAEGAHTSKDNHKKAALKQTKIDPEFIPHTLPTSEKLASFIEKNLGIETRLTSLGHLQRGGTPTPFDRVISTQLGTMAGELILKGEFGVMVALRNGDCIPLPLEEVAGKKKLVTMDHPLIKTVHRLGISLGI